MASRKLIAAATLLRAVDSETASRLVQTGGWFYVRSRDGASMARLKARRRWQRCADARKAAGWKPVIVWMPPDLHAAAVAAKRGQSWAAMLRRLLLTAGEIVQNGGNTETRADAEPGDDGERQP